MSISSCLNRKQGFTLIEMMIALAFLAFGLLAVSQMLYIAAESTSLARSKSTAAIAAQNMIETLGAAYRQDVSSPDLAPGTHGPLQTQVLNPTDESILNRYDIRWTVESIPDPRPGKAVSARRVRITVAPIQENGADNNRVGLNKTLNVATVFSPGI
jgi:prepilin-type N-terminal cleavage/methylation domain-containing protein